MTCGNKGEYNNANFLRIQRFRNNNKLEIIIKVDYVKHADVYDLIFRISRFSTSAFITVNVEIQNNSWRR